VNNKLIAIAAVAAVLTLGVGTAIATQPSSSSAQNNEPAVGATAPASEQNEAAEGQENEANGAAEGQDSDESLSGSPAQQAADAALRATGGGTVLEAEQGDDPRSTYEVEVRKNGGVIEVMLDSNFNVIGQTSSE
jgi:uncharacterized low-complexity protein